MFSTYPARAPHSLPNFATLLEVTASCIACIALAGCSPYKELEFKQVLSGLSGPARADMGMSGSIYIYESVSALESSWVKSTLTPDEFTKLLGMVNFNTQFIYAYPAGEAFVPSTGNGANGVRIESIKWLQIESGGAAINITVIEEFGWNGESGPDCSYPKGPNFPFAIAVVKRPSPGLALYSSGYASYSAWRECLKPKPDSK